MRCDGDDTVASISLYHGTHHRIARPTCGRRMSHRIGFLSVRGVGVPPIAPRTAASKGCHGTMHGRLTIPSPTHPLIETWIVASWLYTGTPDTFPYQHPEAGRVSMGMCGVRTKVQVGCRVTKGWSGAGKFDATSAHLVQPLCVTEVLFGGL